MCKAPLALMPVRRDNRSAVLCQQTPDHPPPVIHLSSTCLHFSTSCARRRRSAPGSATAPDPHAPSRRARCPSPWTPMAAVAAGQQRRRQQVLPTAARLVAATTRRCPGARRGARTGASRESCSKTPAGQLKGQPVSLHMGVLVATSLQARSWFLLSVHFWYSACSLFSVCWRCVQGCSSFMKHFRICFKRLRIEPAYFVHTSTYFYPTSLLAVEDHATVLVQPGSSPVWRQGIIAAPTSPV